MDWLAKLVQQYNQENPDDFVDFSQLLAGAKVIRRVMDQPLELSEMELIRLRVEEKRYQQLVQNIPHCRTSHSVDVMQDHMKSLGMGANLILGLFLTFLAGYYVAKYGKLDTIYGSAFPHILGVTFLCIFLLIEVFYLVLYDWKLTKSGRLNGYQACRIRDSGGGTQSSLTEGEAPSSMTLSKATQAQTTAHVRKRKNASKNDTNFVSSHSSNR